MKSREFYLHFCIFHTQLRLTKRIRDREAQQLHFSQKIRKKKTVIKYLQQELTGTSGSTIALANIQDSLVQALTVSVRPSL